MLTPASHLAVLSLFLLPHASAVLAPPPSLQISPESRRVISLFRKPTSSRSSDDWARWAKTHRDYLTSKYSDSDDHSASNQVLKRRQKHSSGTNLITNLDSDTSFFGSIAVGTPSVSFNVILDTGSSDLWLGALDCDGCGEVKAFDPSASTSFQNLSSLFSIEYGSGAASGFLVQDVVQMAGFSVPNQVFGLCDQVSEVLLGNPVSGLMGLAFQSIAQSGAMPLWQTLVEGGALDAPVMAFHLTRFLDNGDVDAQEPGGSFSVGSVNTTLFTGDIEYTDIPSDRGTYWILPLTSITVSGTRFEPQDESSAFAAIDTGTTLIGGPPETVKAIFAQVPGSVPGRGDLDGYYIYPCAKSLNVSLSFGGGQDWAISDQDMKVTELESGRCMAALFALKTGDNAPSWIVGDTFLKNVYSVFRYTPPSVGFAQLSEVALAMNGVDGLPPTPTVGVTVATVLASGGIDTRKVSSGAAASSSKNASLIALVMGIFIRYFAMLSA